MAYLNFSKKTKIIQLWHGTGTVKKFGQDTNTGKIKKLEYRANRRITHLIVNSAYTKKQYAKAFGIDESRVYILGLPRSDLYLNKERLKEKANRFYAAYPELKQKRLILYAPTFRDQSKDQMEQEQRLHKLPEGLGENDVILFRLHPHVAGRVSNNIPEKYKGKQYNMSNYKEPAALLAVSDILITDYSSIIFEYCLLDKPILFYAYDYEQFEAKGRSFYEDYRKYVPGKVVMTEKELWEALRECGEHSEQVKAFKEKSFRYLDGKSVERLLQEILK
jgi:CDP-ribitol ribitolphosphotransferase